MDETHADHKPTILIVDDERNFTESLQLAIEDEFAVHIAGSLESARSALRSCRPRAVLLDLRLPDGHGLELFQYLRKLPVPPAVIVMTAYASVDTYVQTLKEGAVKYLLKPLDIENLKEELKKQIGAKAS